MKHRQGDRRSYAKIPDFPFLTRTGLVRKERRRYVERRLRNRQPGVFEA